jgi:hypothetical protein
MEESKSKVANRITDELDKCIASLGAAVWFLNTSQSVAVSDTTLEAVKSDLGTMLRMKAEVSDIRDKYISLHLLDEDWVR